MSIDVPDLPFRELLDAAPDGVIVFDQQSRVVLANAQAERIFGYARDQLLGQPLDLLVPDRARTQHGHDVAGYTATPQLRPMGSAIELTGRRQDGSEIPVEISLSPLRTTGGLLVAAGIRDVTERRTLARDHRRADAYLVSAMEATRDGFLVCDEHDRVIMANNSARLLLGDAVGGAIIGLPFDEVLDKALRDGAFDVDNETREALHARWLAYHRAPAGVLEVRTGTGRYLRMIDRKTSEHGTVSVIADITSDVVREGRLDHMSQISKLFATFETVEQTFDPALSLAAKTLPLRSAILIETEDGRSRMIAWSTEGETSEHMQAAKEHLEATHAYLVGAASTGSVDLSEPAGITALPRPAGTKANLANQFIVIPLVVAHRQPFGALQLEGSQPFDEADLMYVNAIANQLAIALDRDRAWRRDITRREHAEDGRTRAETMGAVSERRRIIAETSSDEYATLAAENARLFEQAQHAVRVREQLLAIVSHDLKTPLGTILLSTDALTKKGVAPQAAGRIHRAAQRMQRLIEDLLDFASIEAESLSIRRQPQDPGLMLQETLASFEGVAQDKGLQVTAEIESHLPDVFCDRDRILQVLGNLVGNATKVTPAGGHVTLRVAARGHELLFAVSDDGPGISEEDLAHLFERYWRGGDVQYKGTGLGLAIARGIISAHGGQIWAESELGRGATFHFTIPAADMTSLFTVPAPDAPSSA